MNERGQFFTRNFVVSISATKVPNHTLHHFIFLIYNFQVTNKIQTDQSQEWNTLVPINNMGLGQIFC
jgi:hypothetical protein